MPAIRILGFAGMVPRTYKRNLGDNQAQVATNVRVTSGTVGPLRVPKLVNTPGVTGLRTIFRMQSPAGAEKWLTWAKVVDVVRGPIAGDTTQRIFWTGDAEPRMSNFDSATGGAAPYPLAGGTFVMGAFPPQTAPTVGAVSGGTAPTETRAYVYTFVTAFGEESQPSPPTTQTGNANGTWPLSNLEAAPANTFTATGVTWVGGTATYTGISSTRGLRVGEEVDITGFTPTGYNVKTTITALTAASVSVAITSDPGAYSAGGSIARVGLHNYTGGKTRIYRTVTAASGASEYRYVGEVSIGTTTYNDSALSSAVALNSLLPSLDWAQPPVDGHSIISLPNGIMAMVSKNDIYLSEPYYPHAWPVKYRQTLKHTPMGLGYYGTTIVIPTQGNPYTISGVEPASMGGGAQATEEPWPCLSKRGIVSFSGGVMYPTVQGLVLVGPAGPELVTRDLYTTEEWRSVMPATFEATLRDGKYYAGYTVTEIDRRAIIIDKSEYASVTMGVVSIDHAWTDPLTGVMYIASSDSIYEWDAAGSTLSFFDWMSKEFVLAPQINVGAAKIDADFSQDPDAAAAAQAAYDAAVAANAVILAAGDLGGAANTRASNLLDMNGDILEPLPTLVYDALTFELWVDGALKYSTPVTTSRPFRLPAGYKADNVAVRLSGNVRVASVQLAETMTALRNT